MTLKVIKFSASWCGPCKTLKPVWNQVSSTIDDVEFEVIDIDLDPDTTAKYSVRAVPTIVFVKDGDKVDELVGLCSAETLTKKIEEWR